MKIYLSGRITGAADYRLRFSAAEKLLRSKGFDVINPAAVADMLPRETEYMEYLDIGLRMMKSCDAVYLMEGWKDSKGARLEKAYAECMGLHVIHEDIAERIFSETGKRKEELNGHERG